MPISRRRILSLAASFGLLAMPSARAEGFFRISTGSPASTYYPIGTAIAGVIGAPEGGRSCDEGGGCGVPGLVGLVQSSVGSVANVQAVQADQTESGFSQADVAWMAFHAEGPFAGKPPADRLRGIASLFDEALHLIAAPGSDISAVGNLAGKRVAVGSAGSGTAVDAKKLLAAFGLGPAELTMIEIDTVEALRRMRRGEIDAVFLVAGPPAPIVAETMSTLGAKLVPIDGGEVERLVADDPFLRRMVLPAGAYPNSYGTPTVAVRALWLVSAGLPDELVHGVTAAFWHPSSLEILRAAHPAMAGLSIATALDGMVLPLHPGAAAYYEAQGTLGPGRRQD